MPIVLAVQGESGTLKLSGRVESTHRGYDDGMGFGFRSDTGSPPIPFESVTSWRLACDAFDRWPEGLDSSGG